MSVQTNEYNGNVISQTKYSQTTHLIVASMRLCSDTAGHSDLSVYCDADEKPCMHSSPEAESGPTRSIVSEMSLSL